MKIANAAPDEAFPINMTNMIDVMLVLLIFFLVATQFAQDERENKIQLPGTAAVRPLSAPPRDFVVNINQEGKVIVTGNPVSPAQLQGMLKHVAQTEPDRNVLIRADERSLLKYFAGVAAQCRQAGVSELKIGYVAEGK